MCENALKTSGRFWVQPNDSYYLVENKVVFFSSHLNV